MDGDFGGTRGDIETNPQLDVDYQFTISNNAVTGMQAVAGSHTHTLHLPGDATFTVGSNTVTETLTGQDATTVITYTADAGSTSLYDRSEVTTTFSSPSTAEEGFSFTITNGAVTGVQHVETEHGTTQTETVHTPLDAVFTVGTGTITEQFVHGAEVDTIQYAQPTGSTLYAVSSIDKTFIDGGTATTFLDVAPKDRMEFAVDGSGSVTQAQRVDVHGGLHTLNASSSVTFTQLAPGYVEEVVTHGTHSRFEVYYAGQNANGVYTAIAHGTGSAVDLTGLQGQVAQLPSAVGWII